MINDDYGDPITKVTRKNYPAFPMWVTIGDVKIRFASNDVAKEVYHQRREQLRGKNTSQSHKNTKRENFANRLSRMESLEETPTMRSLAKPALSVYNFGVSTIISPCINAEINDRSLRDHVARTTRQIPHRPH